MRVMASVMCAMALVGCANVGPGTSEGLTDAVVLGDSSEVFYLNLDISGYPLTAEQIGDVNDGIAVVLEERDEFLVAWLADAVAHDSAAVMGVWRIDEVTPIADDTRPDDTGILVVSPPNLPALGFESPYNDNGVRDNVEMPRTLQLDIYDEFLREFLGRIPRHAECIE